MSTDVAHTSAATDRSDLEACGYLVLEGVLGADEVRHYRAMLDRLLARERRRPFDPGDGPESPGDEELADHISSRWQMSPTERARLMRRVRHTRAREHQTPWPVEAGRVPGNFMHIPTLFDDDRSQRIFNLINKEPAFGALAEHSAILGIVRERLGDDCTLLDASAISVAPHTSGGALHMDTPFTNMPEPLPPVALSIQTIWMLDDFTEENGASRVVPGSHLSGRRPTASTSVDEMTLAGPAGSVAMWLSATWHRHGANRSDRHRPGIVCQYGRSWIKPFVDMRSGLTAEVAAKLSPRLRYMMGCGSSAPIRG